MSNNKKSKGKLSPEKFQRAYNLIKDLLDLKNPKISEPMVAFLRQEGVFKEVFLQFLRMEPPHILATRNTPRRKSTSSSQKNRTVLADKTNKKSIVTFQSSETPAHKNSHGSKSMISLAKNALHMHVKSLERAHKVMLLILDSAHCETFNTLVAKHMDDVISVLFDEYVHSDACKLFQCIKAMLQVREDLVLSSIQRLNILPEVLLHHLHNEFCVNTFEMICRVSPQNRENLSKQEKKRLLESSLNGDPEELSLSRDSLHGHLGRHSILSRLAELTSEFSAESQISSCENACSLFLSVTQDTFTRCMWSLTDETNGNNEILLDLFVSAPSYVPALLRAVHSRSASYSCRYSCSKILLFLIHLTVPPNFVLNHGRLEGEPLQKEHIYFAVMDQFCQNVDILTEVLLHFDDYPLNFESVHTNGFTVEKPFTLLRMNLSHLWLSFTEYAAERKDGHNKLLHHISHTPDDVYGRLIDWFFEWPHNNMYHAVFKDIILEMCFFEEEEMLKCILKKHKLVSRFISVYLGEENFDGRSHCLAILNFVRLLSETKAPSSFLRNFLNTHEDYNQFLPRLKEDTLIELNSGGDLYGRMRVNSIGLDSDFAESLGFSEDDAYEDKTNGHE